MGDREAASRGLPRPRRRQDTITIIEVPGFVGGTAVQSINDRADISGGLFDAAGVAQGFLLRQGVVTNVDYPGALYSVALLPYPISIEPRRDHVIVQD